MLFGWLHLVLFGIVVPIVALRTRDAILRLSAPPNRIAFYLGALAQLIVFTAISVFVAWREMIELFPRRMPTASQALIGFAILITLVALLQRQWKESVLNGERVIALVAPSTRDERLLWLLVSLFAGISEEITWRGVQTAIIHRRHRRAPHRHHRLGNHVRRRARGAGLQSDPADRRDCARVSRSRAANRIALCRDGCPLSLRRDRRLHVCEAGGAIWLPVRLACREVRTSSLTIRKTSYNLLRITPEESDDG
ncbi:MAG TPA: hypothetical protein VJ032_14525 [Thermoanaerobaculia bacterium]|nr:hypothetical protein [Thermoanaerobaculia bacterium]